MNGKCNSGDFTIRTLSLMASRLNEVHKIVSDCLPPGSALANYLMSDEEGGVSNEDNSVASVLW